MNKINTGTYTIRPAGRHILTIGKDLIKDNYAAIIELVKNAYDADANEVDIIFKSIIEKKTINGQIKEQKKIVIKIADDGHGMDFNTVIDKWMVPSTDDKLIRKISPRGRVMQGRKGVGRYAAAILGDELLVQSTTPIGEETVLYFDWNIFEQEKYLEDVEILIETFKTSKKQGTVFEITGDESKLEDWKKDEIDKLIFELKKLIAFETKNIKKDKFDIYFETINLPVERYANFKDKIEPFPIVELYDYRISGLVYPDGTTKLQYENRVIGGIPDEKISIKIELEEGESFCGPLKIDFRVFDRDPEAIEGLINRGLKDPITGKSLGKRDARNLLSKYNGIGIYREGFRIRPYGDTDFDWLLLDKQRVQNPSQKIGSDQVIGFVFIAPEEISLLEEKSARDGLKENKYYYGLIKLVKSILAQLEQRRFKFRLKIGRGRKKRNLEETINSLFDFSELKNDVTKELDRLGAGLPEKEKVNKLIARKEEENNKAAEILRDTIAQYQGHVTLGKIVNVVLHEGRKPISFFKNQIPVIKEWSTELTLSFESNKLNKIINRIDEVTNQSENLVNLFGKLDPLAAKKRGHRKEFIVRKSIDSALNVFSGQIASDSIDVILTGVLDVKFIGWESDFNIAFTNILENSIYWLSKSRTYKPKIEIHIEKIGNLFKIDYKDNGPGIDESLIEDNLIFEPGFTTKTDESGTGLGLSIAGEALERNNCELKAVFSQFGAHFIIQSKS